LRVAAGFQPRDYGLSAEAGGGGPKRLEARRLVQVRNCLIGWCSASTVDRIEWLSENFPAQ
jgi:hypothetical protein